MKNQTAIRLLLCLLTIITNIGLNLKAETNDYPANYAREPRFKALLYYSDSAENAHVKFAEDAVDYFTRLTEGEGFNLDVTTTLREFDFNTLKEYNIIIAVNIAPGEERERRLLEKYMKNGGGWLGFHAAGYNDKNTDWPWLNEFLGCGYFYCNNWPPQPALVEVETSTSPITKNLPSEFVAPETEWYQWNPSPRLNPNVEILISLSQKNYPLGIKDIIYSGDFPVVWRNKNYRMVYLNYGHGDKGFTDATQNLLTINAFRYVVSQSPYGDPFLK